MANKSTISNSEVREIVKRQQAAQRARMASAIHKGSAQSKASK